MWKTVSWIAARLVLAFGFLFWTPMLAFSPSFTRQQPQQQLRGVEPSCLPLRALPETSLLLGDLSSTYTYCLDHYYLPTQSATGGVFSSIGDVIAQTSNSSSTSNKKDYDPRRTMNYFLKGLGGGIIWTFWFEMADGWSIDLTRKLLLSSTSESGGGVLALEDISGVTVERVTRTAISIMLEQFLVCPILYTLWDIPLPALLQGSPLRQIPAQIQSKLGPLLIANAKVWTPVNLVTYNIPVELRVLFTSCADIIWQSINVGITSQEIVTIPKKISAAPAAVALPTSLSKATTRMVSALNSTTIVEEAVV